ncbi:DUF2461 domain-containing protein [Daejeonella oryzae]|uniref:DUF2461 domain-containing protein n=1 Tax=Daejeonella oryzae TaxID=1122943 RepID=UPI00040FD0FF|nr:DUF2461 domain-containing protein [Daejeonella oryzae]
MITEATFNFLKELNQNNEREWFHAHKEEHDKARNNVLDFTGEIITELSLIDQLIPADLDPKACVMRIYRDIRFSKDKTPYKTNFGAGISPYGKNFNGPGYYLHINPDECFVAGGCWLPEPEQLKLIRQEIDYNSGEFRKIIDNTEFQNYFGSLETEHTLKTVPKGYSADHSEINYLKLKSFTVSHKLTAKELQQKDAVKKVIMGFAIMHPFIVYLRNALS